MTVSIDITHLIATEIKTGIAAGTMTLGQAVKKLRTEWMKMSQEQFASFCDISVRTLGQVEKDDGNPTIHTLASILSKFGMSITVEPNEAGR